MALTSDMFKPREAWVIGRMEGLMMVQDKPADIYVLLDAASTYAYGSIVVLGELPEVREIKGLFKRARKTAGCWPKRLLVPNGDPAEESLNHQAIEVGISVELVPASHLAPLLQPIRDGFGEFMGQRKQGAAPPPSPTELAEAKAFIPDSYDPCWCASGKKFKFCCKPIFREIVEAMCAFEEHRHADAIRWLDEARAKVGETGEVLCRYAIVYGLESSEKFLEGLQKTLRVAPNHPRAHYLLAIHHKECGDLRKAEAEYLEAIRNYPGGDRFHLNETWNNLGTVYFDMGNHLKAKEAWEKALMYLPSDDTSKSNLREFIYNNGTLPPEVRKPSPFVSRYL